MCRVGLCVSVCSEIVRSVCGIGEESREGVGEGVGVRNGGGISQDTHV